ncbi:dsDNA nuclease domain-containing protein [Bradyrhizobium murdochi]|uniref:dsDNA nuclease domain-containing protein n=1 Tax=Bradyrhizobium murdochi TaxID=1038859 RepID=UPI0003F6AE7C|nr:dsDNA nuclease domain-containing protein [Bradyrhizobium murdochi]
MSFADKLVRTPRREKSGETGYERYDYQASWGLALIFESHNDLDDYAIAFEFHDDIVRLNSSSSPTRARFYQVKTKVKGHWTLTDLTARKQSKDKTSLLPSYIGKMLDNYQLFPGETERLSFVSNVPCEFMDASATVCCFADCKAEDFAKFLAKLKHECSSASESTAKLMHFVRADLSLHDASAHLKGMMQNFVTSQLGTVSYAPDTLYKTIIEECRTKSKFTGSIHSFDDLIKHKAITKSQVNGWLSQITASHALPTWTEISNDLTYGAMEKAKIAKEWHLYRTLALGAGNEAINRVRTRIRAELKKLSFSLDLTPLTEDVFSKVWSFATATISDLTGSRLRAMIIYEVMTYDASGDVQKADQKLADAKP